ncbi:hypothetical protein SH467x_003362 [Pirellulaceae bacterium SH467]
MAFFIAPFFAECVSGTLVALDGPGESGRIVINDANCLDGVPVMVNCEVPEISNCSLPTCTPAGVGGCFNDIPGDLPDVTAFFRYESEGQGAIIPTIGSGNVYKAVKNGNGILCYTKTPCYCEIQEGEDSGFCLALEDFKQEYFIAQYSLNLDLPCPQIENPGPME